MIPGPVESETVLQGRARYAFPHRMPIDADPSAALADRQASGLLDALIESAPIGFALFDTDLRYLRVNEALARINGIPAEDHIGRTLAEVVPEVPREGHAEPLERVLRTGRPAVDVEVTGRTRAAPHSDRSWLVSYYPVSFDGRVIALGAFVVDITERRRAEEELRDGEEWLRLALAETETGTWEWDVSTNEVRWSENLPEIHGLEAGRYPASYEEFIALVHPDDRDRVAAVVERAVADGGGYELELRTAQPGKPVRWLWTRASVLRDADGKPRRLVGITREITRRKRDEQARDLLAEATETLLATLDDEQAVRALADLAAGRLADWCSIDLVDAAGRLETVAAGQADAAAANLAIARLDVENVVRTGRSELVAKAPDGGSAMIVPLVARGRVLGAITLVSTEPGRAYGPGDLAVARELARRAALAIDNARLHRSELEARESAERSRARTLRLQAVTEALGSALTQAEVAAVIVDAGVAALDADAGLVYGVEGQELVLLGAAGFRADEVEPWRRVTVDASHPAAEAARRQAPIVLESLEELGAYYPDLQAASRALGDVGMLAVPIHLGSRVTGVLCFTIRRPREVGDEEHGLAVTMARQCAQALERSRLYEAERRARADAERAAERTERLHELTAALAQAVTIAETAEVLLRESLRAVDATAGWVAFRTDDGRELERVASVGYPESVVAKYDRFPTDAQLPAVEAISSGAPLWFEAAGDLGARFPALMGEHTDAGHEALAILPIRRQREPIGFVALAFSEPRVFGLADRVLLLTVVRQCEQAFERAQLYEHERHVAETLQRSMLPDRLPELAGVSLAARYLPGLEGLHVGGDWYDVIELPERRLGLVVGDVAGKGVPAASTMGRLRHALRIYASEGRKPRAAVRRLNDLFEDVEASFATLVFLVVDLDTGACRYTNAGHLPPLVRRRDGAVDLLARPASLPLGVGPTSYRHEALSLGRGDILLLYTDGLVERRDRPLDEGLRALTEIVAGGPGEPEPLLDRVVDELVGDRREDDVVLLALRLG